MADHSEYCPIALGVDILGDRWTPLVVREVATRGRPGRDVLSPSGESLTPIVWALGHWAAEWVFGDPTPEECDGPGLLWRIHQLAIPTKLPDERTVVRFLLSGPGGTEGWFVIHRRAITVCTTDPGHDVDLTVEADTGQLQRWSVGRIDFRHLVLQGEIRVIGPSRLTRSFPTWFDTSRWSASVHRGEQRRARQTSRPPEAVPGPVVNLT